MQIAPAIEEKRQVFIGRQPIFDRELRTSAYELLFRQANSGNAAGVFDGYKATSQVIHNALMEIGMDELIGNSKAFINFSRENLLDNTAELLPGDRVVIEILENIKVDDEIIKAAVKLVKAGFVIALDDFVCTEEWTPLVELASIIKFDVMNTPVETIRQYVSKLDRSKLKLLAEKVETQQEFDLYKQMGFDYFQGYFFAKPKTIQQTKLPDNHLALVRLLAKLQDNSSEFDEIERLVVQNISLSYKLLRYINSAFMGLSRKVESIQQAIIYFGMKQLKNWATLIAMTDINDKPSELLRMGLTRAKFAQHIAKEAGQPDPDSYYMAGLFSILDVLMDCPMESILEKIPVSDSIKSALIERRGMLGNALSCSIACERNDYANIRFANLDSGRINKIYLEAVGYSNIAMP